MKETLCNDKILLWENCWYVTLFQQMNPIFSFFFWPCIFMYQQVQSTHSTASTMFIFSTPGWWTWPNIPASCKWSKPSWDPTSFCWTLDLSANTRQSNQPNSRRAKQIKANLMETMSFLMWPGTRIWGEYNSPKENKVFKVICFLRCMIKSVVFTGTGVLLVDLFCLCGLLLMIHKKTTESFRSSQVSSIC